MSVYLDIKSLYPHLKVNWNVLMCKICIARRLVVDISRDAMRILCLSLAGRWWRSECELGQFNDFQVYTSWNYLHTCTTYSRVAMISTYWLKTRWRLKLLLLRLHVDARLQNCVVRCVLRVILGKVPQGGRQCDVRVPTRWRLRLLLLWLLRWCTIAELRGALRLARNRMCNVWRMSETTRIHTRVVTACKWVTSSLFSLPLILSPVRSSNTSLSFHPQNVKTYLILDYIVYGVKFWTLKCSISSLIRL